MPNACSASKKEENKNMPSGHFSRGCGGEAKMKMSPRMIRRLIEEVVLVRFLEDLWNIGKELIAVKRHEKIDDVDSITSVRTVMFEFSLNIIPVIILQYIL